MDADGSDVRQLTRTTTTPDGAEARNRQVAFWAFDGTRSTTWLVDRDGTDVRPLTAGTANGAFPDPRPPADR
jgi:hypothetical protein